MAYPVNYLEQLLYVNNIQKRIETTERLLDKITVRSFYPPTQQMWEDAYFSRTNTPPPIPVGVKLVWYNLLNCDARLYQTVYDENGGTTSSGTVYEAVDSSYDRGAIRFLAKSTYTTGFGYANTNEAFIFGSIASLGATDETMMVRMDLTRWSKRHLVGMYIFYEVRATTTPMNLNFLFSGKGQLTIDNIPVQPAIGSATHLNESTNWLLQGTARQNNATDVVSFNVNTVEQNSIGVSSGGIVADSTSSANSFMSGMMRVINPAFPYVGDIPDSPRQNETVFVTGHIQRAGFVANSLYMYETYLVRTDGLPAHSAPFLGFDTASTTGVLGTGITRNDMANMHSESAAWLYGIFADETGRISEFED